MTFIFPVALAFLPPRATLGQPGAQRAHVHMGLPESGLKLDGAALIAQRAERQAAMAAALSRAKAASRKAAALSEGAHVELSAPDAAVLAKLQVRVTGRLGEGHFGSVLLGEDVSDGGRPVAVKVARELEREAAVLRLMDGTTGFPALRHHHKVRRHYRDAITNTNRGNELLVTERLGRSLQAEWEAEGGPLGAARVREVGRGALRCLHALHRSGIVHNDIKPANLVGGPPGSVREAEVHLIDFGISTRLEAEADVCEIDALDEQPPTGPAAAPALPDSLRAAVTDYCGLPLSTFGYLEYVRLPTRPGTPAYASVRLQEGEAGLAREVDDLESLVYTLAFLAAGSLPWEDATPEEAARWKRSLLEDGWTATLAGTREAARLCSSAGGPSSPLAHALEALWAEVVARQAHGRTAPRGEERATEALDYTGSSTIPVAEALDYTRCLEALEALEAGR